ncbi:MAG: hypothetical protein K0R30_2154 [Ornithinibacter sp.]|jgi:hypothetical protein|nr:hypothetical protein [Ornithinibacter sp.]
MHPMKFAHAERGTRVRSAHAKRGTRLRYFTGAPR